MMYSVLMVVRVIFDIEQERTRVLLTYIIKGFTGDKRDRNR